MKVKTGMTNLNLSKSKGERAGRRARFRLIFAAKAVFRLRFCGPSRVKIFQQNPLVTKNISKKCSQRNAQNG
jgi:hypothetical protein